MKLAESDLLALLPPHIADDPAFSAAGRAVAPHLRALARAIPNLLIFASLGHQDPQTMLGPLARLTAARGGLKEPELELLESLAWQFHVDFREAARTREELAGMVLSSIPWHRIKGTPASIKAALALCGYGTYPPPGTAASRAAGAQQGPRSLQATAHPAQDVRVGEIIVDEDGEGYYWAAYQLGLSGVTGMDDLARIVSICREMQPARCRMWRVYTPDYDFRPGVWSGPLPLCAWSNCWWSEYSGSETPDIPGLDDSTGLIVSFGARRSVLVSPLCGAVAHAALLLTLNHGWQTPLLLFPAWSECSYGDVFPRDHSFTFAHLYSFTWAEAIYEQYRWAGPWDGRCWRGATLRVDRRLPPWRFHLLGHSLTEGVWSGCEPDYTPTFRPDAVHGRVLSDVPGTWSALNFWGGAPRVEILPAPQVWSEDAWSEDILAPNEVEIPELVPCLRGEAVPALEPGRPLGAVTLHFPASTAPLCPDAAPRWTGRWNKRRWRGHCGRIEIKSISAMPAGKRAAAQRSAASAAPLANEPESRAGMRG